MGYYRQAKQFNNRKTVVGGVTYDSIKEANYAGQLLLAKRGGLIKDFTPKPTFVLLGLDGTKVCKMIPDFLVTLPDGSEEAHEVKSKPSKTPVWRLKKKLFESQFKDVKYVVVE